MFRFFSLAILTLGTLHLGSDSRLSANARCDGGSIVVIIENWDKIVRVSSKDLNCVITHVKIASGTNSVEYEGCDDNSCDLNVNQLESGTYEVVVYTASGYFAGDVYIP